MKIDAGKYNIIIERGAISKIGEYAASAVNPSGCVIVSDDNVHPIYGETVRCSLTDAGFDVRANFVFPHGEESKNLATLEALLNHLSAEGLTRTDCVFALGGGVTGDMTGFAAAVYLRGIKFVQIPTSLLAAVDSSVGGKTAVDLAVGKNLVGAFHMPSLVVCDPDVLDTLPPEYFSDGMAEVIKMGFIGNPDLIELLSGDISDKIDRVIAACVKDKADIVARDTYDKGERQKLNLGHTVGHAMEALSEYKIHHGSAVASGMHVIAKAAAVRGTCPADTVEKLDKLLEKYGLDPYIYERFSAEDMYSSALHDKKMRGNTITVVIPVETGRSELFTYQADELLQIIKDGAVR
ncbi:MAG: 3-dehydroquinate synthase [Ruminococcaceae bacterium]|nr:3-dehydroquinate synthase [Oscillospiraceae bacterium]